MCASRSSAVRSPGDLFERVPRRGQIGQHQLFRDAGTERRDRGRRRPPGRVLDEREMADVRDRRRVAQLFAVDQRRDDAARRLVEAVAGQRRDQHERRRRPSARAGSHARGRSDLLDDHDPRGS